MATESDSESQRPPLPLPIAVGSGLLMGGADAVPGVSGGTIALIIGIYERFIESLSTMVRSPLLVRDDAGRDQIKRALLFLIPLGFGIAVSYFLATKLLVGPKDTPGVLRRPDTAPMCYAFFFGLVLLSVREPWKRISSHGAQHWLAAAVGFGAAAGFAHLPYSGGESATWMLLLGGAGAISIMLLPGVSGSLFLVIIGQYNTVAQSVHDRDFATLGVFLLGIALGAATFVPVLRMLLRRVHDGTMSVLTGLMAGSLFALWPWKDNYESKQGPMNNVGVDSDTLVWVIVAAVCGGAVVWLLAQLEKRVQAAEAAAQA